MTDRQISRWYLYVITVADQRMTLVTDDSDVADGGGWRLVAAGTEDACDAAARLWRELA